MKVALLTPVSWDVFMSADVRAKAENGGRIFEESFCNLLWNNTEVSIHICLQLNNYRLLECTGVDWFSGFLKCHRSLPIKAA